MNAQIIRHVGLCVNERRDVLCDLVADSVGLVHTFRTPLSQNLWEIGPKNDFWLLLISKLT